MLFGHIHSTKESLWISILLHVQVDFTIGEYKKLYVAYKLDTNFVDIVFQKQRLRISINMKFSEINDPNGICKDITGMGRWGNGDVELFMEHQDELDQIMEIVKQSFDAQAE